MKKMYMQPAVEAYQVKTSSALMAGSTTTMGVKGEFDSSTMTTLGRDGDLDDDF